MRDPDVHSGLVRAVFVPICKRSRIVRVGIREGWYPPNTEIHLSRTRVPGVLGESAWAYRAAQAPPICTKPLGRRFWHFRAVMETSRGRIATLWGTCRPGLHGQRCARLTSILGLSGAVEHAGGAGRVSFRSAFMRGGIQPTTRYTSRGRACRGCLLGLGRRAEPCEACSVSGLGCYTTTTTPATITRPPPDLTTSYHLSNLPPARTPPLSLL